MVNRLRTYAGIASFLLLASSAHPAFAAPDVLRVGVFGVTLPGKAGLARGFYAAENLDVQFLQVTGSVQQFEFLRDGKYDLIQTGSDNVVNYKLNAKNPLGALMDVQLTDGLDLGMGLGLVAQPQFQTAESLRGKKICVDAPKSGFAYVVYKILAQHGLKAGDYPIDPIGGVFIRYKAMLAGSCDATLLSLGFEVMAAAAGKRPLDTVLAVADPYLATCSAGKREWMQAHRDLVIRYERATYKALRWVLDPANRDAAVGMLVNENTPRAVAEKLFDSFQNPKLGLIRDMELDRQGLANVVALRAEYGGFDEPQDLKKLATPEGGLYDLSYLRAARGG